MKALLEHSSTLGVLSVDHGEGVTSNDLVEVLALCPNLRSLNGALDGGRFDDSHCIHANVFIDLDLDTGALRTWACEAPLKELKIVGILRPSVKGFETYPGQSRQMQHQVYDRLARLINLEVLWLEGVIRLEKYSDCLEMSLDSGLHMLSGLKKLKKLDVSWTAPRIGVQEVQWMTEHWPRLHVIGELFSHEDEEAVGWLQENRPEIELTGLYRQ